MFQIKSLIIAIMASLPAVLSTRSIVSTDIIKYAILQGNIQNEKCAKFWGEKQYFHEQLKNKSQTKCEQVVHEQVMS